MTDRELNKRLAKAMGWEVTSITDDVIDAYWHDSIGQRHWLPNFSPATSVDALRKWVLPEIKRRRLTRKFDDAVGLAAMCSHSDPEAFDILSCEPSTIAAAALEVMEEDNDSRL